MWTGFFSRGRAEADGGENEGRGSIPGWPGWEEGIMMVLWAISKRNRFYWKGELGLGVFGRFFTICTMWFGANFISILGNGELSWPLWRKISESHKQWTCQLTFKVVATETKLPVVLKQLKVHTHNPSNHLRPHTGQMNKSIGNFGNWFNLGSLLIAENEFQRTGREHVI